MAENLSGWLIDPGDSSSDLAREVTGKLDAWFAGEIGSNWRNNDDIGLAGTLDLTPGWDSSASDKLANLKLLVDDVRYRVRLIPPGYPLATVLDGIWGDDSWRRDDSAGLSRALDQLPGWQDDSWVVSDLTLDTLRDWLTPLPAAWAGGSVLQDDPETGLKYDDSNWYLSNGTTIVNEDPANPGYFYDAMGNWYHKGQPSDGPVGAAVAPAAVPADLTVQHYDEASKRWRRKWGSGERDFEHYHDRDGVWEREIDAQYPKRFHSDKAGWLPYYADSGSEWWLASGEWKKWEDVGKRAAPTPAEQPAEDLQQVMEGALQRILDGMLTDSDLPPEELAELTEFAEETRQRLLAIFSE